MALSSGPCSLDTPRENASSSGHWTQPKRSPSASPAPPRATSPQPEKSSAKSCARFQVDQPRQNRGVRKRRSNPKSPPIAPKRYLRVADLTRPYELMSPFGHQDLRTELQ